MIVDPKCRVATLPSVPFDLDLSNDGALIACATQTGDQGAPVVTVLQAHDGSQKTSYMQLAVENARGVAFVGDGRELVFLFERVGATQLYRVALDSREPEQLQRYPATVHNHAIIRDARASRFAVLGNQIEIWDAAANKVLHVIPGADPGEAVHAAFSRDGAHLYAYGTVAGAVVRYATDTGKELARWDAPSPFGAQVVVTPDERYLLAAANSFRGMHIYDLKTGARLEPDPESVVKLDAESQWRPWVASQDSAMFVCLKKSLWCLHLPDLENVGPRDKVIEPSNRAWVAAAAWDAPRIAFGTAADSSVRWFELGPDA